MSKKNFVQFTKEEFESVLDSTDYFFRVQMYDWANEYIYEAESSNGRFSIRVYSSIDKRTKKARDKGSDAIRVVVIHNETGRPVMKQRRVNRIETWPENLKKRIRNIQDAKGNLTHCDKCGSLMIIRKNSKSGDKFYGCLNYPECNNTKSFDE